MYPDFALIQCGYTEDRDLNRPLIPILFPPIHQQRVELLAPLGDGALYT